MSSSHHRSVTSSKLIFLFWATYLVEKVSKQIPPKYKRSNSGKRQRILMNLDHLSLSLVTTDDYKYIKDFSKITKPLTDLLPGSSSKKNKKQPKTWQWTHKEQHISDNLKENLTKPPVLAYQIFQNPSNYIQTHREVASESSYIKVVTLFLMLVDHY